MHDNILLFLLFLMFELYPKFVAVSQWSADGPFSYRPDSIDKNAKLRIGCL